MKRNDSLIIAPLALAAYVTSCDFDESIKLCNQTFSGENAEIATCNAPDHSGDTDPIIESRLDASNRDIITIVDAELHDADDDADANDADVADADDAVSCDKPGPQETDDRPENIEKAGQLDQSPALDNPEGDDQPDNFRGIDKIDSTTSALPGITPFSQFSPCEQEHPQEWQDMDTISENADNFAIYILPFSEGGDIFTRTLVPPMAGHLSPPENWGDHKGQWGVTYGDKRFICGVPFNSDEIKEKPCLETVCFLDPEL